jgi:hypothetical protein
MDLAGNLRLAHGEYHRRPAGEHTLRRLFNNFKEVREIPPHRSETGVVPYSHGQPGTTY